MNGGSLVSSEINTLNLNLSLRLNLRFNLKLNLNVSLKLNLNLKLNLGLKFGTEFFFFYLGFLSRTFTIDRVVDKRENYFFNSFLQRPTVLQTLRHQPGDYFRRLTSPHSEKLESTRELFVSVAASFSVLTLQLKLYGQTCLQWTHPVPEGKCPRLAGARYVRVLGKFCKFRVFWKILRKLVSAKIIAKLLILEIRAI